MFSFNGFGFNLPVECSCLESICQHRNKLVCIIDYTACLRPGLCVNNCSGKDCLSCRSVRQHGECIVQTPKVILEARIMRSSTSSICRYSHFHIDILQYPAYSYLMSKVARLPVGNVTIDNLYDIHLCVFDGHRTRSESGSSPLP